MAASWRSYCVVMVLPLWRQSLGRAAITCGVFLLGFEGSKQILLGMFGDEGVENLDNILDHHLLGGHAPLIDGQANLFP